MPFWLGLAIALLYGALIGSFLNVCIWRLPREESLVSPGSHCPKCDTPLKSKDLIPLFSFLVQRCKCRYCSAPISWRYFSIELLTSLYFGIVYWQFDWTVAALVYALFGAALIAILFIDLEHEIIPDQLNIFCIVLGVGWNVQRIIETGIWRTELFGLSIPMPESIVGMVLCGGAFLLVALISYYILKKEGMGGGDVKLAAGVGAIMGAQLAMWSFMIAVFLGTIIGIALIVMGRKGRKDYVPFGPFMVVGAFIMIFFKEYVLGLWEIYMRYATGG